MKPDFYGNPAGTGGGTDSPVFAAGAGLGAIPLAIRAPELHIRGMDDARTMLKALGWLGIFTGLVVAAGCGSRDESAAGGEVDYLDAAAKEPHVIGYDPTGLPVYGVDANGNPTYKPDAPE